MKVRKNYSPLLLRVILFVCFLSLILLPETNAQSKKTKKQPVEQDNNWTFGFSYGENGFGPFTTFSASLSKSTDLDFSLSFSGISDSREFERFDRYGNSIIVDKVNRVFMMPLSIGVKYEMFKNEIEGNFSPVLNIGIAPTMVFTNPYEKNFFSALGYTQTHFAFGGYGGFGVNFRQSETVTMNINFNYYYLPLVGEGVHSLSNNTIDNVGGLQLAFGISFF